jgi:hypothetical protein
VRFENKYIFSHNVKYVLALAYYNARVVVNLEFAGLALHKNVNYFTAEKFA